MYTLVTLAHMSEQWVRKLKAKFWQVCHAGVQFQWKKNRLLTTIRLEYLDFSCHSTRPTQEAWKLQFWPADFTFPIMAQLYDCGRQCGRPVGARCSMGFGPNPLINGLLQHTFKLNILFLEKFTVIHFDQTKLFPINWKSPWCFRKKDFSKTKTKSEWDFQLGTSLPSPPSKKKQVALEKLLRLHTRGGPAAAAEQVNYFFEFFF